MVELGRTYCHLFIISDTLSQVWLNLADHYIAEMKIDWDKTVKFAFNERSNPDDNTLGLQIVKVTYM